MPIKTLLTLCVHPFPASPSSHLLVGEDVQQPAPEGGRADDDAARGQVHSRRQRGGGGQHPDQALPERSLNDVPLVKSQAWGDVAFSDLVMVRLNVRAENTAGQQGKSRLNEHSPGSVRN